MTYAMWGINPGHPVMGTALLVLSELVTNCVRHAASVSPEFTVIFAAGADTLAFAVHDRHPHQLDALAFSRSEGGLRLVAEAIGDSGGTWAVRPDIDGRGKSVWITLPL